MSGAPLPPCDQLLTVEAAAERLSTSVRFIRRLVAHGHDVARIDHGWCVSIYADDTSGIMVEFCTTTKVLDDASRRAALELLAATNPAVSKETPDVQFFEGLPTTDHAGVS